MYSENGVLKVLFYPHYFHYFSGIFCHFSRNLGGYGAKRIFHYFFNYPESEPGPN